MLGGSSKPHAAFSEWWKHVGLAAAIERREELARFVWDAAIKAAVVLLDDEVMRFVNNRSYPQAAAIRDCRELAEGLFTSPGQWTAGQRRRDDLIESFKQLFRKLSAKQLEEVRRSTFEPNSPEAQALDLILREHEIRGTQQ